MTVTDHTRITQHWVYVNMLFFCKEKATYDDKCDFDLLIYQE